MTRISLMLFVCTVALMCGCSAQDKPLPATENNFERLMKEVREAEKDIPQNPNKDMRDVVMKSMIDVVENKLGYSFDLTYRNILLFYRGSMAAMIMGHVDEYIAKDPQWALDQKYISERTYEVIKVLMASNHLTPVQMEFLQHVANCQHSNGGICTGRMLLTELQTSKRLTENKSVDHQDVQPGYQDAQPVFLEMEVNGVFGLSDIVRETKPLIRHSDSGKPFNLSQIFTNNIDVQFYIDEDQMKCELDYQRMYEEEKVALSDE